MAFPAAPLPPSPHRPITASPFRTAAGRSVLWFLGLLSLFRLVYAARLGLAEDEAYYWQWSRHLDLSYYDQGPGIAYVIRLGTILFGHTHLGIRAPIVLLGALTGWFIFLTARRWLDDRAALWAVGLTSIAPLFAIGGVLATYDAPQVFFWTAALYALTRTLQDQWAGGWYVVGLLVGLGTLTKLTMLAFAPGVLLFLLLSPRHRTWLATPHPYLAFGLALLLCAPMVVWNAQHEWLGLIHLRAVGNRSGDPRSPRGLGDFFGGHALTLSPLLFLAELFALCWWNFRCLRRSADGSPEAARFLFAFSVPLLALCLFQALRSKQEINWPAPAHVTGLMAVGAWFAAVWQAREAGKGRAGIVGAVGLALLLTLIVLFPGLLSAAGITVSASVAEKLNQTYGWPKLAARAQAARETLEREDRPVFVTSINYRVNSVLAFYLADQPETKTLYLRSRRDQYQFWTEPRALVGQSAVLVIEGGNDEAVALARRIFGSVEPFGAPVVITRAGFLGTIKTWYVYLCRDFQGYDPEAWAVGY